MPRPVTYDARSRGATRATTTLMGMGLMGAPKRARLWRYLRDYSDDPSLPERVGEVEPRFARVKELLKEPEAQRVLRLSLCQSLGDRVIWRLACSALLNGLAPPHKPHATDLHRRRGRPDVGRLDIEGCARRKRQHVSIRHATLWS